MRRRGVSLVELVSALAIIGGMILLLLPAVLGGHEAARAIQCRNNMKQIGLGLLNYHDEHQGFPPGYTRVPDPRGGDSGRSLSWGIPLLSYVEQTSLSGMIARDSDVGGAENLTARLTYLNTFACPSDLAQGDTLSVAGAPGVKGPVRVARASFVGSFGTGDPLESGRGDGMFLRDRSVRIDDVLDGTSTTFLLGERRRDAGPTTWAGLIGPLGPAMVLGSTLGDAGPNRMPARDKGYSSKHPGGVFFGYGDGSVRFVGDSIERSVYGALATRRGGEVIGDFEE